MGTWGVGAYENDDALDWLRSLERHGAAAVAKAFRSAIDQDYLEATVATPALAAAEVLLLSLGETRGEVPEEAHTAARRFGPEIVATPGVKQLALQAIDRILAPRSELYDLWLETEDFEAWKQDIIDMRDRLVAL